MKTNLSTENSLIINQNTYTILLEAARWSRLIAIFGFVSIGLMVVAGVVMGTIFTSMGVMGMQSLPLGISGSILTFFYLLMAALYYFPIKYLYDFSIKIKKALLESDQMLMNEAFLKLKSHYQYIGILILVMLCVYAFSLFVGLMGAVFNMV